MRSLALTGALTGALLLAGCAATGTEPVAAVPPAPTNAVPPQFQYLYGSGEGGAVALGVFHSLIAYVTEQAARRPTDSVVLAADSAIRGASWAPCGDKPLAVVFDVDETLIQNLGFEARAATGEAYDQARWSRWEQSGDKAVAAMPGAAHAVDDLRKLGVTVVFNSNRSSANAAGTVAAIKAAGLGEARHGETLFLKGDDSLGSAKDGRRAIIASRFCVVAMVGDQLGDFSDLFAAVKPVAERRDLAIHSSAAGKWGKGWFIVPNPVYGSALAGDQDAVFPADKRWADPAEEKK